MSRRYQAPHRRTHPYPEQRVPPEGYRLVEDGLHRACTEPSPASFSFIESLQLKLVINMGSTQLRDSVSNFFLSKGIRVESPCAVKEGETFDRSYGFDGAEETMKDALQLLLEASSYPVMIVCGARDHESARLISCLRRLQQWTMTAIIDEYRVSTNTGNTYDINLRFVERFDLDLVTLPKDLPLWLKNDLDMVSEEEEFAEEFLPYLLGRYAFEGPLISKGCAYSEKKWLLAVDDD
ncbi:unnamed protein product [Chrysoparadoxa australica]